MVEHAPQISLPPKEPPRDDDGKLAPEDRFGASHFVTDEIAQAQLEGTMAEQGEKIEQLITPYRDMLAALHEAGAQVDSSYAPAKVGRDGKLALSAESTPAEEKLSDELEDICATLPIDVDVSHVGIWRKRDDRADELAPPTSQAVVGVEFKVAREADVKLLEAAVNVFEAGLVKPEGESAVSSQEVAVQGAHGEEKFKQQDVFKVLFNQEKGLMQLQYKHPIQIHEKKPGLFRQLWGDLFDGPRRPGDTV